MTNTPDFNTYTINVEGLSPEVLITQVFNRIHATSFTKDSKRVIMKAFKKVAKMYEELKKKKLISFEKNPIEYKLIAYEIMYNTLVEKVQRLLDLASTRGSDSTEIEGANAEIVIVCNNINTFFLRWEAELRANYPNFVLPRLKVTWIPATEEQSGRYIIEPETNPEIRNRR